MIQRSISFWIYFILFSFLAVVSPVSAIKPSPPLKLSLHQADVSEGETKVTFFATAHLDLSHVELSMELSPGLSSVEGQQEWEGPLKKGETQKLELIVLNPRNAPREVTGKATVHLEEGGVFIQRVTINLDGKTE